MKKRIGVIGLVVVIGIMLGLVYVTHELSEVKASLRDKEVLVSQYVDEMERLNHGIAEYEMQNKRLVEAVAVLTSQSESDQKALNEASETVTQQKLLIMDLEHLIGGASNSEEAHEDYDPTVYHYDYIMADHLMGNYQFFLDYIQSDIEDSRRSRLINNYVNFEYVEGGDVIAGLSVSHIRKVRDSQVENLFHQVAIGFEGQLTVSGNLHYGGLEGDEYFLDISDFENIPYYLSSDHLSMSVCMLGSKEQIDTQGYIEGQSVRVTLEDLNLSYNYDEPTYNYATFVGLDEN